MGADAVRAAIDDAGIEYNAIQQAYAGYVYGDSTAGHLVGVGMTREAAHQVYEQAGVGPGDIDVVELHDCFAHNELISYEGLGLCVEGEAEKMVCDGDNTYGGKYVINPSGGLLSKGHPLGATGLAQRVS